MSQYGPNFLSWVHQLSVQEIGSSVSIKEVGIVALHLHSKSLVCVCVGGCVCVCVCVYAVSTSNKYYSLTTSSPMLFYAEIECSGLTNHTSMINVFIPKSEITIYFNTCEIIKNKYTKLKKIINK